MIGNRKDLIRCNNTSRSLLSQNWWFSALAPVLKVDCSQADLHMKQERTQCVCVYVCDWRMNTEKQKSSEKATAMNNGSIFQFRLIPSLFPVFFLLSLYLGKIHLVFGKHLCGENLFSSSFLVYVVFLVGLCDIDFSQL